MPRPKVSVVTINRNMARGLEATIQSVQAQSYPCIEYVVIDGHSTDGSIEVIKRHADRIAYWVSERDRNLYDAMNKGVRASTGDWVIFMNSGDIFADAHVVRDVFAVAHTDRDLIYGHAIWHHPREKIATMRMAEQPDVLPLRMNCSHQSLFARRELLISHPFDVGMLVSDYAFLIEAWRSGARFHPLDRVVSEATAGGISDRRRLRSLLERIAVLQRNKLLNVPLAVRYLVMILTQPLAGFLRLVLPRGMVRVLLKLRKGG